MFTQLLSFLAMACWSHGHDCDRDRFESLIQLPSTIRQIFGVWRMAVLTDAN